MKEKSVLMKYTRSQKAFWISVTILIIIFSLLWLDIFNNHPLDSERFIILVFVQTFSLAFFHWWGTGIVRSSNYRSRKYESRKTPFQPSLVDQWNTVQTGVFWVTIILGLVPIFMAYFLSS